jgi:hypothetical protein
MSKMDRRYSVTRAEVQALPRFVVADLEGDDDEEIIEEGPTGLPPLRPKTTTTGGVLKKTSFSKTPLKVTETFAELSVDEDEYLLDEEEILEEEYEEIIEEDEEEIIIEENPPLPPADRARMTPATSKSPPFTAAITPNSSTRVKSVTASRDLPAATATSVSSQDEPAEDEESVPDAEDVLEALKYILRQEKPVENGLITAEQEAQMLGLPLSEMVDIMKHFELCDNENAPIRWDLVCLMIHAVEDEPELSEEEVEDDADDDHADETGRLDESDNDLEAIDEVGSLGSGYDLETKDDTCYSELSDWNESGRITE